MRLFQTYFNKKIFLFFGLCLGPNMALASPNPIDIEKRGRFTGAFFQILSVFGSQQAVYDTSNSFDKHS